MTLRTRVVAASAAVVVASLSLTMAPSEAQQPRGAVGVPLPTVAIIKGKTPNATAVQTNIGKLGYVEREYAVTITNPATYAYTDSTTHVTATPLSDPPGTYKSRIFVRLPTNPQKFNGRVIVEMLNTTAYADMDIVWMQSHEYLMNQGYAYVGVTVQQTGLAPLSTFVRDPNRYAGLALNLLTPAAKADLAKYNLNANRDPSVAWDLVSQVGQLFKTNGPTSPLHGYTIKHVYLTGQSQMAGYMVTYINAIHPIAHVYDGFFVVSGGPYAKSLGYDPNNTFAPSPAQVTINGGGTPVILVQTETDVHAKSASRRPDSNTSTDRFRLWEYPGAAHLDGWTKRQIIYGLARDYGAQIPLNCGWNKTRTITEFPMRYGIDAAIAALNTWVTRGVAPPSGPRIATTAAGTIVRDSHRNATGGVRLPNVQVPVASFTPSSPGTLFCGLAGSETPFTKATLKKLYPTRAAYAAKVKAVALTDVKRGFLTPFDANQMIAAAKRARLDGTDR